MQKRKVLVCGATGFIGRNIMLALGQRADLEVYGTSRRLPYHWPANCRVVMVDLTKPDDVARAVRGQAIIIHAAAVTGGLGMVKQQPYHYLAQNLIINTYLAEAALEHQVQQFVFMSCSVLYPPRLGHPVSEHEVDVNLIHPAYQAGAWVKLAMEQLCAHYATLGRTSYTMVRHSNLYGPYDQFDPQRSHVFAATLKKVLEEKEPITLWGDGTETRDWLYVDDLTACLNLLIDCPAEPYQVYNIGTGQAVSVNQLARQMIDLAGRPLGIAHDLDQPQIDCSITLDCSRVAAKLGWRPQTELAAGILKTINWYHTNQKEIANVNVSAS